MAFKAPALPADLAFQTAGAWNRDGASYFPVWVFGHFCRVCLRGGECGRGGAL